MKIQDHFLTKEIFDIIPTEIPGVLRTDPIPKNLDRYYESDRYISHNQDENSLKHRLYKIAQSFNLNYKRNIVVQETTENSTILDYGCGAGEFVKYVENQFNVYGFEPNNSAAQKAELKTTSAKFLENVNSIEDHSLDAITLWHVFEHIEKQKDALELFYKKLKKEGVLIIAVPNHTSYDAKYYKEFWAAYDVPRHLFHFSKNGMTKLFNDESWQLKKIKPLVLDAYYIALLSEKYKKNPLFWLKAGLVGAISNFKALKTGEYSSLIYIIRKK